MSDMNSLEEIAQRVSVCTDCALGSGRTRAVPGEGPGNAEIMFIGEGPGVIMKTGRGGRSWGPQVPSWMTCSTQ